MQQLHSCSSWNFSKTTLLGLKQSFMIDILPFTCTFIVLKTCFMFNIYRVSTCLATPYDLTIYIWYTLHSVDRIYWFISSEHTIWAQRQLWSPRDNIQKSMSNILQSLAKLTWNLMNISIPPQRNFNRSRKDLRGRPSPFSMTQWVLEGSKILEKSTGQIFLGCSWFELP